MSRDALAHWLDLMNKQGWIAREQVMLHSRSLLMPHLMLCLTLCLMLRLWQCLLLCLKSFIANRPCSDQLLANRPCSDQLFVAPFVMGLTPVSCQLLLQHHRCPFAKRVRLGHCAMSLMCILRLDKQSCALAISTLSARLQYFTHRPMFPLAAADVSLPAGLWHICNPGGSSIASACLHGLPLS